MRPTSIVIGGLALILMGQGCRPAPVSQQKPAEPTPAVSGSDLPPTTTKLAPAAPAAPKAAPKAAPRTTTVKPKTVVVEMKDDVFSPQVLAINVGDTVVWKNVGTHNHTTRGLRNGPLVWDSGNLAPGQSYSRKFTAIGRFGYGCSIHAGMNGEVIVGEANAIGQ